MWVSRNNTTLLTHGCLGIGGQLAFVVQKYVIICEK